MLWFAGNPMAAQARSNAHPKNETRVLLLENVHASAHELFRAEGFQIEAIPQALSEDELIAKLSQEGAPHLLGIRSKTRVTARVLEASKNLLSVGCFCIGTNQVDLSAAKHAGVPVFNAPFSNTRSVAELVICEIVMLARQLGDRSREVHEGKWRKVATSSYEVRGKTLGIIGYGHIGSQVGVLAESMGMRVVFHDVRATLPMGNNKGVDSLEALLHTSDFVTLHVPETAQTKGMIGRSELSQMKDGAYLINLSRGTVVDLEALAFALTSKKLAGAAIDVYPKEPESNSDGFESVMRGLSNVVLTPHIGGSTLEAQEAIGREVSNVLARFTTSGATVGAVNFPAVDPAPIGGAHRVLNIHRNVPGVLRDINRLVSDRNANVIAQQLATDPEIGYLVMDLDKDVATDVRDAIATLETSIMTRIVY